MAAPIQEQPSRKKETPRPGKTKVKLCSLASDGREGANLGAHEVGVGSLTFQQLFVLPLLYHLINRQKRMGVGG